MKAPLKISMALLGVLLLVTTAALADLIEFESLPLGTAYGSPYGNSPGDFLFAEDGAAVFISDFISGGMPYFQYCQVVDSFAPPVSFHHNHIMNTSNVDLVVQFSSPGDVSFDFLDFGGSVNLQVNGYGAVLEAANIPSLAGTLAPGINMTVTTAAVPGGHKGTATITGPVQRLRVGGQEFYLDEIHGGDGGQPAPCDYEVSHQSLSVGMGWGASYGNSPGDFMFAEDGIPVFAQWFLEPSGEHYFGDCLVAPTPDASFGFDQVMRFNNINNIYDLAALGVPVGEVSFEYLDYGGVQNLQVNGGPLFSDNLTSMPANVAPGVTMVVTSYPVGGGTRGLVTLAGDVQQLMIGGQEFFADNICVGLREDPHPCDLIVDNESQILGTYWGAPYGQNPGDLIFIEDGIGVFLDVFDTGGGLQFSGAGITMPQCDQLDNQVLSLNNITAVFDLSEVQPVNKAYFDFCDCGGIENLAIDGVLYVGDLDAIPAGYFGSDVVVQVQTAGPDPCLHGTVAITGALHKIGVGGQELQVDNFCVVQDETSAASEETPGLGMSLGRNYPNPFNPSTTISFSTDRSGQVQLMVVDLAGRHVADLFSGRVEAGAHEVQWNGLDQQGRQAATGIYLVQLRTSGGMITRKITLVK